MSENSLVSPISRHHNLINLLWRTNCESDVRTYEVHCSTRPGFAPDESTRIGIVEADTVVKGSTDYGHVPADHRLGEYDHMMFLDETVQPRTTYYYRVCAVDAAGQGDRSCGEASARTKDPDRPFGSVAAQSVYSCIYGPWNPAMNGIPWQRSPWMSKPYGGAPKTSRSTCGGPSSIPRGQDPPTEGPEDHRPCPDPAESPGASPPGRAMRTVGEVKDAKVNFATVAFQQVVAVHAVRCAFRARRRLAEVGSRRKRRHRANRPRVVDACGRPRVATIRVLCHWRIEEQTGSGVAATRPIAPPGVTVAKAVGSLWACLCCHERLPTPVLPRRVGWCCRSPVE